MKKIPRIKSTKANRPRNAFDLSQKHVFSAPPGALLPILSLDLNYHDHVEIQASDFMRTMPMNTAAFVSMRSVYEFFFVPYSQLWHPFDQFITGMKDFRSSAVSSVLSGNVPQLVPCADRNLLFSAVKDVTTGDIFGFPNKANYIRLLDLLGYGRPLIDSNVPFTSSSIGGSGLPSGGNVSLFRLAAYNKIYNDYYRNTTYELQDLNSFNLDLVNGKKSFNKENVGEILKFHYRNAPIDYLTNIVPKPLFDLPFNLDDSITLSYPSIKAKNPLSTSDGNESVLIKPDATIGISVSSIRSAFALDKLLQISMRAGKTYAEQIEAHFGVSVSEGRDGQVYYLGGFDSNVQVGDVTQTSGTTDPAVSDLSKSKLAGYLGKVTGKGVGSGSGRITFDAKEPGILMCIYSLVPAMQYDSNRLDPFLAKVSRGDFFIPEFENLGMQPLRSMFISDSVYGTKHSMLGWQPRYSEYKTAVDINHGQFINLAPLSYWTIGRFRLNSNSVSYNGFKIEQLKINPHWLDSIFAVNYNGEEITDCIFGYVHFNIQKVSDMSEDGMPKI